MFQILLSFFSIRIRFFQSNIFTLIREKETNFEKKKRMEQQTNLGPLCKPIPITPSSCAIPSEYISIAGSDINSTSQVYLLYEVPTDLLAKRFLLKPNVERFKLLVIY